MTYFQYSNSNLFAEKCSLSNIIKKIKTPFYLYSEKQLTDNFLNFKKSFKNINPLICYSVKANPNLSVLFTTNSPFSLQLKTP